MDKDSRGVERRVGTSYEEIAEKHGTPVFLLNKRMVFENACFFRDTARKYFPNIIFVYSVKTNSLPQVLEKISKSGFGFEVASLKELVEAMHFVEGEKIVFNGVCKKRSELKKAIDCGVLLINCDSESELKKISEIAKGINVGIRFGFKKDKFGFDRLSLLSAFKKASSLDLNPVCMSSHPGTSVVLKEYACFLDEVADAVLELEQSGITFSYLDLGGGFKDFLQMKSEGIELKNYFALVREKLSQVIDFEKTTLVFEPGRNIVSSAVSLLARVEVIKEKSGNNYAVIDAGINILPKITLSRHEFERIGGKEDRAEKKRYVVAGPLLFSNDELGVYEGNLSEGDLILVKNAGAYCQNLSWDISYGKPKTIVV